MKPLFVSDLDGTLLNQRGELEEDTVVSFTDWRRKGIGLPSLLHVPSHRRGRFWSVLICKFQPC